MKIAPCLLTALLLTACGVETASTAATVAAAKKLELEQGQKSLQQLQQNLDQAGQQTQQRMNAAEEREK